MNAVGAPGILQPKAGTVICGDAATLISTLADRSVNLCLTSPPYAMQRRQQYGGVAEKDYPAWMCGVMAALRPKLTDDGSALIVIRAHVQDGIVSDYVLRTRLALREDGWCECEELIWLKPDAPPLGSKERPRRTWEQILWFSKTPKPFTNLKAVGGFTDRIGFVGSRRLRNGNHPIATQHPTKLQNGHARTPDHFTAPVSENENGILHPAMFPVTLCEKLILTFSREEDLILDCFAGSGNALKAAQRTGRKFIGFDIKKEYVELAANRLSTTFTEHTTVINPGQQVRLRTDFPDTKQSRRIYFQSRKLNVSDAAVFEFILLKTVNGDGQRASAELSHNQIAAATTLSRRTVIRSIERLERVGMIETAKHEQWHMGNANRIAVAPSLLVPVGDWA
jgi:DNA modification methylase